MHMCRISQRIAYAGVITAAFYVAYSVWRGFPSIPILTGDSGTYLLYSYLVPIGYPLFANGILTFFSSLSAIAIAQTFLFACAICILSAVLLRIFINPFLALFVALLLICSNNIIVYNFIVGTDGVLATLLVLHLACVAQHLRSPSSRTVLLGALTAGLCIAVRPAALFLLIIFPFFTLIHARWSSRFGLTAACGVLVVVTAFSAAGYIIRGNALPRLGGAALYPHVASLYDPARSKLSVNIKQAVERSTQVYKTEREATRSRHERYELESRYFNALNRALTAELWGTQKDRSSLEFITLSDKVRLSIAIDAILANPLGYLEVVSTNIEEAYRHFILLSLPPSHVLGGESLAWWFQKSKISAESLTARLGLPQTPVSAHTIAASPLLTNPPLFLYSINTANFPQFLLLGVVALSALVLFAGLCFRRLRHPSLFLGCYAFALHFCGIAFVALTTVFIPRYAAPLDVLLIVGIVCAADLTIRETLHLYHLIPARKPRTHKISY